jgi:hypothetical protein
MSAAAQPVNFGFHIGFQQIGDGMFVTIQISVATLTIQLAMPVEAAKIFSRQIRDAAETAEVQVIKPASMLAQN